MRIDEPSPHAAEIIPIRVRWLAIASGCFSGVSGSLLFGPLFILFPSIQILGAIIQPYSPRSGRLLLSFGAFFLSFYTFLFLGPQAFGALSFFRSYIDLSHITLFALLLASLISVAWCDVALIVDAKQLKHIRRIEEYSFPLTGDWIVWIVAGCVSLVVIPGSVWGIFEYRRNERSDILAGGLVLGIVTLLFDLAIVRSAMKTRLERRSRNPKL